VLIAPILPASPLPHRDPLHPRGPCAPRAKQNAPCTHPRHEGVPRGEAAEARRIPAGPIRVSQRCQHLGAEAQASGQLPQTRAHSARVRGSAKTRREGAPEHTRGTRAQPPPSPSLRKRATAPHSPPPPARHRNVPTLSTIFPPLLGDVLAGFAY